MKRVFEKLTKADRAKIKSEGFETGCGSERPDGRVYWIYLKDGWRERSEESHAICEDTKGDAILQLKYNVEPCECKECKK